ncbi:hypothetical protein A2988_00245 [Candidatus Azambacteria bacterium RIFCSPLOWO2_01_FULL_46_25]|uniref:DUF5667 domain-containing protein n=1 Tax=Candidatus Azambacteria bacterium RIFCSPLOWO2_01_FULL_46_25 TaxID=1797298 RepID=A0A1F5BTJ3_9BACT|nr:MAG: hypothetical protein A2988_00245 [Candidatus Azambacteria bacterium RIFCSPLOWO2_01_FULL_46_25]OGD37145.1 MAG: hypothetical protein A2850_04205 [Candidatus Azambacteria bacterium RIFCSPHIGHO2_01_FULL_51_74]
MSAGEKRKAEFRVVLRSHMAAYPALEQRREFGAMFFFFAHKGAAALLVVAVVLTTGGVTLASQNALPGDTLYPLKLRTEQVRVALSASPAKKSGLHLEFASRRLNELEKIVQEESARQMNVDALLINYKTELEESQKLLDEDPRETEEIATRIDRATSAHQQTIKEISEKSQKKTFADTLKRYLDDADEHAESQNEFANLALLAGTSTEDALVPGTGETLLTEQKAVRKEFQEKSRKKIRSVQDRVSEMEQTLKKAQSEGASRPNAEQKLEEAKHALENARTQSERGSYGDSFITSVQARKAAKEAERMMEEPEQERSEHDENE